MISRLRHIICFTLILALLGGATSCRTKKDSYTPSTTRTTIQNENNKDHTWSTLDIKLTKKDNKLLYKELKQWLGTPYKYAAANRGKGTDCSGMVMEVFKAVYGIKLERNSAKMFEKNCREIGKHRLREADLVFFNNGKSGRITHVGVYLKDGYFVHASSSRGVIVSHLEQKYYVTHFQCAGRVRELSH